jgi:hypothetical protein
MQIKGFSGLVCVNEGQYMSSGSNEHQTNNSGRRSPALIVLAVLLFAEALGLAAVTVWLILAMLTSAPASFGGGIAIIALALGAAAFMFAVATGSLRGKRWIRGAAVTWQLMQMALALGAFQGVLAVPSVGWALLIPAVLVIVLLFTRSVITATSGDDPRGL